MDKSISRIALAIAIALMALVVLISVPAFSWQISGDSEVRYQGVTNGGSDKDILWIVDTKTGEVKWCERYYSGSSHCSTWITQVFHLN